MEVCWQEKEDVDDNYQKDDDDDDDDDEERMVQHTIKATRRMLFEKNWHGNVLLNLSVFQHFYDNNDDEKLMRWNSGNSWKYRLNIWRKVERFVLCYICHLNTFLWKKLIHINIIKIVKNIQSPQLWKA